MGIKEAEKLTISSLFLLRPLGIFPVEEKVDSSCMKDFGFRQAYIADMFKEPLSKHPVYLLFKQEQFTEAFTEFISKEYERGLLLQDYDYPEGYTVLEYQFPEVFRLDYQKIIEGKYSKTSTDFQKLFPMETTVSNMRKYSLYYRVFNKTQDMVDLLVKEYGLDEWDKENEVHRIMKIQEETLDITRYTEFE